ncbi:MAG: methyltransferase domain-containing protein, partial [Planctomycetota bacterium]|nr:methyltransferase domain-containing protein [Planctomycetota bacterium]
MAPASGILFDQYSRYGACARSVRSLLPEGGTVLDVGSGRPRLLGRFLPGYQVTYLDPGLLNGASDSIASDLFEADLAAGSFDVVTNIDTLEHIPLEDRSRFIERLIKVAKRGVVLAAPFVEDGLAAATDQRVNEIYRAKTGQPYPWLEEHEAYGLPSLVETEQQFRAAGLDTASVGNGRTQWLEELLGLHVLLLEGGQHTSFLESVGDYFAEHLEPFDHLPPVYRQIIVAWTGQDPDLVFPHIDEATFHQAATAWETFRDWFQVQLANHLEGLVRASTSTQKTLSTVRHDYSVKSKELSVVQKKLLAAQQESAAAQGELDSVRAERERLVAAINATRAELAKVGFCSVAIKRALGAARWMACRMGLRGGFKWRVKSAFFWVLRPLVRNTREYHEFLEARAWRNRQPVVTEAKTPSVFVTPADRCLDDVIVFGVINWNFRIQRPQHLTLELARRGHRVFYISPGFIDLATPGFQLEPVDSPDSVYEVRFHATELPMIYEGAPSGDAAAMLAEGLRQFLAHVRLASCRVLVDHPSWHALAGLVPRASVFYDCMDNHSGFAESSENLRADEDKLLVSAAGVVVSSDWLSREIRKSYSGPMALIRNGCDPDHFASTEVAESTTYCIGYFGAIAEWFDRGLVMQLAKALPECQFLLVGNDTAEVTQRLRSAQNVQVVGEIPYHELPHWISRMDVCLIPFL